MLRMFLTGQYFPNTGEALIDGLLNILADLRDREQRREEWPCDGDELGTAELVAPTRSRQLLTRKGSWPDSS